MRDGARPPGRIAGETDRRWPGEARPSRRSFAAGRNQTARKSERPVQTDHRGWILGALLAVPAPVPVREATWWGQRLEGWVGSSSAEAPLASPRAACRG